MTFRLESVDMGHSWTERPIQRLSLHDEIAAKLRVMIQEGELAPGTRVPEVKLCQHFGISRTPLREALKVLASEGLIELRPNRGSIVSPIKANEIRGIFEVLQALEHQVGATVTERILDDELTQVLELNRQLLSAHRGRNQSLYFRLHLKLQQRLADLTENVVLSGLYASFLTKIARACTSASVDAAHWEQWGRDHTEIMARLADRDGHRLSQVLQRHSRSFGEAIVSGLKITMESYDDF